MSDFAAERGRPSRALGRLWLFIALLCCWLALGESGAHAAPGGSERALRFEPNVGQFEAPVRYLARSRDYALFLTERGVTLTLQRAKDNRPSVVTMTLRGAGSSEPRGLAPLAGSSNYFTGNDPAHWRSGVQAYGRVRYESVLPGVDVEYYGTEGHELEYDFTLAAGVAPSALLFQFEGVSGIELAANGEARLRLPDGSLLTKRAPIAYQVREGQRTTVNVRYELRAGGLGFVVAEHDGTLPLIIDPVLSYATYFGGSSFDEATSVAADSAGNTYLVGYTASTLFPTRDPVQPTHGGGSYDAFVVKLDPTGQSIVYSTYLGGNGPDIAYAVAADALGNAYIAGLTQSTNFPTLAALQATPGGGQDAFVAKLNATGSALLYATYLGGTLDDYARGIVVSGAGAAYLVGTTFSANFPKTAPLQAALSGTYDAFVAQIAPGGASLVYSTYVGGSGTEFGNAIALDTSGSAYVVGATTSSNFPTANARQATFAGGGSDAFLCKLNLNGSGFVYSTYLGGSGSDEAFGVSVFSGTPIVVGSTLSSNFPLALAEQPAPGGNNHSDGFVTRFDPSGLALVYSTYLGGTGSDVAAAVTSDSFGNAYVTGQTDSTDFPVLNPLPGQDSYRGAVDAFIGALNANGSRLLYASYLGGTAEDRGVGIAISPGRTHVAGTTRSTDFPKVTPLINGLVGSQDAFVVKLPSVDAVSTPALGTGSVALLMSLLLVVGLLLLSARRPAHRRNAR
jgi:Beta-propeller repeat